MRDVQRQARQGGIEKSRYDKRFGWINVPVVPAYLRKRWRGKNDAKIIARFRCGRRNKCGIELEWVHLLQGCIGERHSKLTRRMLLSESGEGLKEMKNFIRNGGRNKGL